MTRRDLNRALLARQMLLEREPHLPIQVVEQLFAVQAQEPRPPFIGLWSRVAGFEAASLRGALAERRIVRATTLRGTLHMMSAADYLAFRSTLLPRADAAVVVLRERAEGLDIPAILAAARGIFRERPRTFTEARAALAAAFPDVADERAMGYLSRLGVPLVAVPGEGTWGYRADPVFAEAESCLGVVPEEALRMGELVRRYLAAFGPATVGDFQAWSGLKGAKEVFERLRPELEVFRDEKKRELFDLLDAPRPGGDVSSPVRYVADYDNVILAHADRSRIIDEAHRPLVVSKNLRVAATFLVDGFVAGTWQTARKRSTATLSLKPFADVPQSAMRELEEEGLRLLRFLEPDADRHEFVSSSEN